MQSRELQYLGEESLVEFEVLLLDVVETVVAVRDEHDGERDELEQRTGVDDDSHQSEYEHLDQTADTLGQQDQQRIESGHTQTRCDAVLQEASNSGLTTSQTRKHRGCHRRTPFHRHFLSDDASTHRRPFGIVHYETTNERTNQRSLFTNEQNEH